MADNFDYIIVGGGTAGCVVASRLSENPNMRVLLIESGRKDSNRWIHIPATFFKLIEEGKDTATYYSETSNTLNGRSVILPQGHVLGGGSSVNAMIYIRGQREDYDSWGELGLSGWSYQDVLPIFRDLEHNMRDTASFHEKDGEVYVSDPQLKHPLSLAFIHAAQEIGIQYNDDFNGVCQRGVGFYQCTIKNGRRWGAVQAFLRKAENRSNLKILTSRHVNRIIVNDKQVTGVELEDGAKFYCKGEVIICAGAMETPRLLQLSGIGNADELKALGIDSVSNLPGVGENFQDHLDIMVEGETKDPISIYKQDKGMNAFKHMLRYMTTHRGLLASNLVECGGFIDVSNAGRPDLQLHMLPFMVGDLECPMIDAHGMTIALNFLRPLSRGSIKLRSSQPKEAAIFNSGALTDERDVDLLVKGVRKGIDILEAPFLAKLLKCRTAPAFGMEQNEAQLRDYIRNNAKTLFHPASTCKMGADDDKMAVLDHQLRVRGVHSLRVCDASAMPNIVSGNLNAPTMMIAERCARFIKASWL